MAVERLQKILSAAGVASRRAAEELIVAGRVEVNGKVARELGTKADPAVDRVTVDGRRVQAPERPTYLLLNKPRGYLSTLDDPQGRPTVKDLLPPGLPRVYHVGRLDTNTEGLLLLTNDGALAERVAHPRFGCEKTYLAKVSGIPSPDALERLRRGVRLEGRRTAPAQASLVRSTRREGNAWVALVLREGRSHEVRRMLESVGHPVSKLRRVRLGPITDKGLEPGQIRLLTPAEVRALRAATVPGAAGRPPRLPEEPGREPERRDPRSARAGRERQGSQARAGEGRERQGSQARGGAGRERPGGHTGAAEGRAGKRFERPGGETRSPARGVAERVRPQPARAPSVARRKVDPAERRVEDFKRAPRAPARGARRPPVGGGARRRMPGKHHG